MSQLNAEYAIKTEARLRSLFAPTHEIAVAKALDHIDTHARSFIERSPFLLLGTQSAEGAADVSPRGDPRGFVTIHDKKTLLIPDRPGNNRLDSLSNIISNPVVGLLFLVPGFDDTMRVNGSAELTTDPDLLRGMAVADRIPKLAIVITVHEVFIHCAKALRRARLWDPDQHQDRKDVPSLMKIILDQTSGAPQSDAEIDALDASLEEEYRNSMY